MRKLVLIRHGESEWNKLNLFTGWTDVGLSEKGNEEAREAGKLLKENNYQFDIVYTSFLKRAIKTMWIILEEMGLEWLPVRKTWRLNERHYGALQGLNKQNTAQKYGEEQVRIWRRSYRVRPPALTPDDARYPGKDLRYKDLTVDQLPLNECLEDNLNRTEPYWDEVIKPSIESGLNVLIVAHGNSLRALIKIIDNIPDDIISQLNIPTGIPLIYELDQSLKPLKHYYLGNQEKIKQEMNKVKNQGKVN